MRLTKKLTSGEVEVVHTLASDAPEQILSERMSFSSTSRVGVVRPNCPFLSFPGFSPPRFVFLLVVHLSWPAKACKEIAEILASQNQELLCKMRTPSVCPLNVESFQQTLVLLVRKYGMFGMPCFVLIKPDWQYYSCDWPIGYNVIARGHLELRYPCSRAAKRGGFKRGGASRSGLVLPFLSFWSLLGLPRFFWDFPDLSRDCPGISRFVVFLFRGLFFINSTYEEQSRRVCDTIRTIPEKSGKPRCLETPPV